MDWGRTRAKEAEGAIRQRIRRLEVWLNLHTERLLDLSDSRSSVLNLCTTQFSYNMTGVKFSQGSPFCHLSPKMPTPYFLRTFLCWVFKTRTAAWMKFPHSGENFSLLSIRIMSIKVYCSKMRWIEDSKKFWHHCLRWFLGADLPCILMVRKVF